MEIAWITVFGNDDHAIDANPDGRQNNKFSACRLAQLSTEPLCPKNLMDIEAIVKMFSKPTQTMV